MMYCHKCKADVHPAKIMATANMGECSVRNGFYNQCPRCQCPMADDPEPEQARPIADVLPIRPMVGATTPQPKPQRQRTGSIIDDARAELDEVDAEIVRLEGEIARAKTEITLKKAHRKGLLRVVATYERAVRSVAPSVAPVPAPKH